MLFSGGKQLQEKLLYNYKLSMKAGIHLEYCAYVNWSKKLWTYATRKLLQKAYVNACLAATKKSPAFLVCLSYVN